MKTDTCHKMAHLIALVLVYFFETNILESFVSQIIGTIGARVHRKLERSIRVMLSS